MFALSVLMSSMICFNSFNEFEEKTLEEMSLIKDLHSYIKINLNLNETPG